MKRLYVGGLSHAVTQKELKDRFGKFGDVQDVELRTRKDETGAPYKTFGYININISEADLKRCMTMLNKSKWKGGTLQIETAKDSVLHRLARERKEAQLQCLQPPTAKDNRQQLLESLSKAGVDNFTMKSAVPGTEVPGHKDWVVTKFGRVLPILQLRCKRGSKAQTLKYDPSKYSHNICRLDRATAAADHYTPITQLTWEIPGGDSDISKKRRGEFPPFVPLKAKKNSSKVITSQNVPARSRYGSPIPSETLPATRPLFNGYQPLTKCTQQSLAIFNGSVLDSDEEICKMVATPSITLNALQPQDFKEEDHLEVVGLDHLGRFQQKDRNEEDYDSPDTDELLTSRKPPPPLRLENTDNKKKTKRKNEARKEDKQKSGDEDDIPNLNKPSCKRRHKVGTPPAVTPSQESSMPSISLQEITSLKPGLRVPKRRAMENEILAFILREREDNNEDKKKKKSVMLPAFQGTKGLYKNLETNKVGQEVKKEEGHLAETTQEGSETKTETSESSENEDEYKSAKTAETSLCYSGDEEEEEERDFAEFGSVSHYEAMFSNVTRLEISMADLQRMAEGSEQTPKTPPRFPKKGTKPDGIIASAMRDSADEEKKKKESTPLSVFQGTEGKDESEDSQMELKTSEIEMMLESNEEEEEEIKNNAPSKDPGVSSKKRETSSSYSSEKDVAEKRRKTKASAIEISSSSSTSEDNAELALAAPRAAFGAEEDEEQQRKDNVRRLAAIQQRLKEAEQHRKLIQGALANLGTAKPAAGKHIVFNSGDDDDDDPGVDQKTLSVIISPPKLPLFEDSQSESRCGAPGDEATNNDGKEQKERLSGPQLFGGSDDEEGGDEEEEDSSRFDTRPQFEGQAGQKLLELQSRFGTDKRFRMDSRFLEEDMEEYEDTEVKVTEDDICLGEEKKRNLSIMQCVLGSSNLTHSSRAKTFKDMSVLQYDPSKEEHVAFETKPEETKESKSARRKRREEAQKLPEVSKDIYYDVKDLRAVFGPTEDDDINTEAEEKRNWDQKEDTKQARVEELMSSLIQTDAEKEESGFKFSFFGYPEETEPEDTSEYKVENIQTGRVSWKKDLSFQDSSSEEEQEEPILMAMDKTTDVAETLSQTRLFFFLHPQDSRLTEGPSLFCRSSELEDQRDEWEERRTVLRQEYRKKHKEACKKLKTSLKS